MKGALSSIAVRWAGPGFYLAHQSTRGIVWQKLCAYVTGAVWADEAADLHVPATSAASIIAEAKHRVNVNRAERGMTAHAYGIRE